MSIKNVWPPPQVFSCMFPNWILFLNLFLCFKLFQFQNEIDIPPPGTIILTNASLCNGKWHSRSLQLGESSNQTNSKDEECTCTEGLLYLKITDKSKEKSSQLFYPCPVFLSQEDLDLSQRNSVAEIPFPVTEDSLLFYGKKVHLHFSHKADV